MLPKASGLKNVVKRIFAPTFLAAMAVAPAQSAELAVIGAIEAVDCKAQKIQVLGITFFNSDVRVAKVICGLKSSFPRNYVSLVADVDGAGVVRLTRLTAVHDEYVPGATPVYLRGEVSNVRADVGLISISGAQVSIFELPTKGNVIEIIGTQPNLGGVVLPSEVKGVSRPPQGINSSIGTGVNSSIGTGINSSIGTGINSSIGTGRASVIGTG